MKFRHNGGEYRMTADVTPIANSFTINGDGI